MLYNIHTGHGVKKVPNEEIVIFVSTLLHLQRCGCTVIFTDQHAYPPMARYYTDLSDLNKIDWPLLQNRDFKHDPEDPGKKERYQAEALVWKHVPLTALQGVCCFTSTVQRYLIKEVDRRALSFNVGLRPSWYFQ